MVLWRVKPTNNGAVRDHLLQYNYLRCFYNSGIFVHENKEYLLEIKESLPTLRDKPPLNRGISRVFGIYWINVRNDFLFISHKFI